eukprot:scaffold2260_cov212-Pinguiococcus_pyrenoidosus.AAC.2
MEDKRTSASDTGKERSQERIDQKRAGELREALRDLSRKQAKELRHEDELQRVAGFEGKELHAKVISNKARRVADAIHEECRGNLTTMKRVMQKVLARPDVRSVDKMYQVMSSSAGNKEVKEHLLGSIRTFVSEQHSKGSRPREAQMAHEISARTNGRCLSQLTAHSEPVRQNMPPYSTSGALEPPPPSAPNTETAFRTHTIHASS